MSYKVVSVPIVRKKVGIEFREDVQCLSLLGAGSVSSMQPVSPTPRCIVASGSASVWLQGSKEWLHSIRSLNYEGKVR